LTLCGHDVAIRTPKGEEMHVQKRGAFFLRHDRRFSVEASDNCYTVLMRIDRKTLLDLVPRGFDPDISGFAPGGPMVDLLWSYLPVITGGASEAARQSRDMLGRHVIDIVAMMLKPSRDAAELISGRGLKAVRTRALLDAIDRHFATPELSPAMIARHLGISPRQVHRLLEETPKTFVEHVLERRLQGAHAMLAAPDLQGRSIAEVALACGFADVTHFNRAFRARFGDTPTGIRGAASRDETMRVLRDSVAPKR
jgi:AraC-like DNA-binding protein